MAILFYVMELWKSNLHIAFVSGNGADATLEQTAIQNLLETGTRNRGDRLGGPPGQTMYAFPVSDALNYGLMAFIGLFGVGSAFIMNVFNLLTFPLAAMTATYALFQMKISSRVSIFAGVLYAFMSYHFYRGQSHLLLSAYYMVPLGILVAFYIMEGRVVWPLQRSRKPESTHKNKKSVKNLDTPPCKWHLTKDSSGKTFLLSAVFALLISSTGIYYACFAGFFFVVALGVHLCRERRWTLAATGATTMIGLLIFGVFLNLLPNLLYLMQTDETAQIVRSPISADVYGLSLLNLFLPNAGHRLGRLKEIAGMVNRHSPLVNENSTASLGVIGSFGFLLLLAFPLLSRKKKHLRWDSVSSISKMAYTGLLLATAGGFGSLLYWTFFRVIRAYNRISVFLFFFALAAIAFLLDRFFFGPEERVGATKNKVSFFQRRHTAWSILLIPLLLLGLFDQIPRDVNSNYQQAEAFITEQEAFFAQIEEQSPENALIFQLPYIAFPEPDEHHGLGPYAHLDAYLLTDTLRWSAGIMRGYREDEWYRDTSQLPWEDLKAQIFLRGYQGIYIHVPQNPSPELEAQIEALKQDAGANLVTNYAENRLFFSYY